MGRQTEYTEEMALTICDELSAGKSLRQICEPEDMPNRTTVYRWLNANKDFSNHYARAREEQGDHFAEQIIEEIEAVEDAAITRVKVDSLKWLAGRLNHKQWGDKKTLAGDADNPLALPERVVVEVINP